MRGLNNDQSSAAVPSDYREQAKSYYNTQFNLVNRSNQRLLHERLATENMKSTASMENTGPIPSDENIKVSIVNKRAAEASRVMMRRPSRLKQTMTTKE